jgi:hypothetical protein
MVLAASHIATNIVCLLAVFGFAVLLATLLTLIGLGIESVGKSFKAQDAQVRLAELQTIQHSATQEQARIRDTYIWQMMNLAMNRQNKPDQEQENQEPQRRTRRKKGEHE